MVATWEFTLVVEGADLQDEELIDRLFEAGLDDATVSRSGGVQLVDVARDAETYREALFTALRQLRQATGATARVVRVEPDQLVTMAEIAERSGRSREGVRLLIAGERGPGGFPAPLSHGAERTRLWRWSDVVSWFRDRLGETPAAAGSPEGEPAERINAAVNARLEWLRYQNGLEASDRQELDELLTPSSHG